MKVAFIVFCVFTVSLFFRAQRLPESWTRALCAAVSSEACAFRASGISFGFQHGVELRDLKVIDRSGTYENALVASATCVRVRPLRRRVDIQGLAYPRLPASYYHDPAPAEPPHADIAFSFPRLPSFRLVLVQPCILGIAPERAETQVFCHAKNLSFSGIRIEWPERVPAMALDGNCKVDLNRARLEGSVAGTAVQAHIRPLLKALDLPVTYPYMGGYPDTGTQGFTSVEGPIPARCEWTADLRTAELTLELDLHPGRGRYNNVALRRVDGGIGVHVYYVPGCMNYDTRIGPLVAVDPEGRTLRGTFTVHGTNGLDVLEFDAESDLKKDDLLDIVGYLNDGIFDGLICETPPRVTARGIFNVDEVNIARNDFSGEIAFARGSLFELGLLDAYAPYSYRGDTIVFSNMTAKGIVGGAIAGMATLHLPAAPAPATFELELTATNTTIGALAGMLDFNLGDKHGRLDLDLSVNGPVGETNFSARVSGRGSFRIFDGHLARIPLFLALTDALSKYVPGLGDLLDQSDARGEFTLKDGVFASDDITIEGPLFCLKGHGRYDFARDNLDFTVRTTLFRDESIVGKLLHPLLWPFTKAIAEIRLTGPIDAPKAASTSYEAIKSGAGAALDVIKPAKK